MILYFADRRMNILGQASTELPNGMRITEDNKTEEIDSGVSCFECNIPYTDKTRSNAELYTTPGNYILRKNGNDAEFYTIIDSEAETKKNSIYIYAEDAGLDLINEIVEPYQADKAYSAAFYIEKFAYDSGFEIGVNEISNLTRKLSWDGEETAAARILSVATQFDNAEISYSFDVENMSVIHKYINLYKTRGKDIGKELRLNRDIDSIRTKRTVKNLATALIVKGGTPEESDIPITLAGYKYDDGDFYVDGTKLLSRTALSKWSRYLSETGDDVGHIVKTYSFDTLSQSELCNRAISHLKQICDMEVNYEVDIAKLLQETYIGDTVNIVDASGKLYLSARLLKIEESVCDEKKIGTIGEFLIKGSGVSQRVEELAEQFGNIAQARTLYTWTAYADDEFGHGISTNPDGKTYLGTSVNNLTEKVDISDPEKFVWVRIQGEKGKSGDDAVVLRIESSRGTVFKNNSISTVLNVAIYKGSERITDIVKLHSIFGSGAYIEWSWQRLDDNTFGVISSSDKMIGNNGFTLTISSEEVDTNVTFKCELKN